MAIGADITRTFSPLTHSLPQLPSTRFSQKELNPPPPQNNSTKSTFFLIVPLRAPKTKRGNLGWRMPMPLCTQTTRAANSACQCSSSQLLAGNRRLQVPRRFNQTVLVTSCPGGSPSSLAFVIRSCLSSFVSHSDGCDWRAQCEATPKVSFLKLRAYWVLKAEIMQTPLEMHSSELEMQASVSICMNFWEKSLITALMLINFLSQAVL